VKRSAAVAAVADRGLRTLAVLRIERIALFRIGTIAGGPRSAT
jgi:hypothetical protein